MRNSVVAILFLLLVQRVHATIDASLQMQLGNPSGAIVDTNNHDHYLITRSVEAIDYSDNLGEPNWVSWDLTAGDVGNSGRSSSFYTDTNLPPNFYWVTDNDYNGVGNISFTRGHMCPSEDRTDTVADNKLVFYMSNIIPQSAANNEGPWGSLEDYCRSLAQAGDEILITCGPSGLGANRIPSGKAVIADYTWKIAVVVPPGGGTALSRITNSTRVITIKIPNTSNVSGSWTNYITSPAQIEADTGLTFFTALPANVATSLVAEVDGPANYSTQPVISSFTPNSGLTNATVVITGTNFASTISVSFNGAAASFNVDSNTQITAIVPPDATSGPISITTPNGTGTSSMNFTVYIGGGSSYSGILVGWDVNGVTGYGSSPMSPTTSAPDLTVVGLTRGAGVFTSGTAAGHAWGGVNFTNATAAQAIAADKVVTFSISPNAGYLLSFSNISRFDYRHSGTGPTNGVLQFQIGTNGFIAITNLSYPSSSGSGASIGAIDLSSFPALQNIGPGTNVTFRIVNYAGSNANGSWYIYDVAGTTDPDFALSGTLTALVLAETPSLSSLTVASNQFSFAINGTSGSSYIIEATTDPSAFVWTPVLTNTAPFTFTESNLNLFSQRFYRAVQGP